MDSKLNVEQILELLSCSDQEVQEHSSEPEYDEQECNEQILQHKLVGLFKRFEGGSGFNDNCFRDSAVQMLMPLLQLSHKKSLDTADLEAFRLLSSNFSSLPILRRENRHWLEAIYRRLGERNRMRNPYNGDIRRDLPYEMFSLVVRVVNNLAVNEFYPPLCFYSRNRKGEVQVSFTTSDAMSKLFALLSGLHIKIVKRYFNRSLEVRKQEHMVKLLVSETKDIAFVYKFSKQQSTICYNYGEWNTYGFPQRS